MLIRWLLDSAERCQTVIFSIIPSGRVNESSPKAQEKLKRSHTEVVRPVITSSRSSLHDQPGYTPPMGALQGSNYSLVSSTDDTAAYLARSSISSSVPEGNSLVHIISIMVIINTLIYYFCEEA